MVVIPQRREAPEAWQKVARGKRLCAPPLDQVELSPRPEWAQRTKHSGHSFGLTSSGPTSVIFGGRCSERPFRARSIYCSNPGAARKSACPWLPSAAPLALFELPAKLLCSFAY